MVTIELPDESYERARERAAELGVDVGMFIAAAIDVYAAHFELSGQRSRDELYGERLSRIGPDIDQAVERWRNHASADPGRETGDYRDLRC